MIGLRICNSHYEWSCVRWAYCAIFRPVGLEGAHNLYMKWDWRTLQALAIGGQIGISIVASLGLAIGGGYLLDKWLNTRPLFLLIGIIVGLLASAYTIQDLSRQFSSRRPNSSVSKEDE